MKTVTIIGFGRFGQTLYRLIKSDFDVTIYSRKPIKQIHATNNLEKAYNSDIIFFAVPISSFENVIKTHKKFFKPTHVLIDVLSVKVYPKKVFQKYLNGTKTQAILTHPMFGPDSSKNGFENLPFIINQFTSDKKTYDFWKKYLEKKQLKVIEMTPEMHDKIAADSQGLTHFIGRLLEKMNYKPTPIDSLGTKKLGEIKEQTCNDTWELFHDLQTYNPYTKQMRLKLGKAYETIYNKLLPSRVNSKYWVYGIQGGIGSFNEQAILHYLKDKNQKYKIKYLYTTKRVLESLRDGDIDYGLFAISNSTGGLVEESMKALTQYQCNIVEDFEILIRHFLMIKRDADKSKIKTIMAHPQVLAQCKKTLEQKYSQYTLKSGTGDLIDTAKAAEYLSLGKLPNTTAILGPVNLANRYSFEIIAEDLQDKKDNLTRFLLVKR